MMAVIPARCGSKRLPQKNWKPFWKRENLVEIAIRQARDAGLDDIVVTADWPAPLVFGAVHVPRPADLATDDACVWDAVEHACRGLAYEGPIILLQPTSPLRGAKWIRHALESPVPTTTVCGSEPNGAVYTRHWRCWYNSGTPCRMPIWRSVDIDTEEDWRAAQALYPLIESET